MTTPLHRKNAHKKDQKLLPSDINEMLALIDMHSHCNSIAVVLHYSFDLTNEGYINERFDREVSKRKRSLGVTNEITQFLRS